MSSRPTQTPQGFSIQPGCTSTLLETRCFRPFSPYSYVTQPPPHPCSFLVLPLQPHPSPPTHSSTSQNKPSSPGSSRYRCRRWAPPQLPHSLQDWRGGALGQAASSAQPHPFTHGRGQALPPALDVLPATHLGQASLAVCDLPKLSVLSSEDPESWLPCNNPANPAHSGHSHTPGWYTQEQNHKVRQYSRSRNNIVLFTFIPL